ncbi:condensation domain-containing protein, partial [Rhodococcoides yunnanense]|uniref:condensation domain-containing protein n=1 Tax=Rhodococcoides yunnanense TaxID=278209 RepID=UPI001FE65087
MSAATVVADTVDPDSDVRSLIAYVVADEGFDTTTVQKHVGKTLPRHMVPSFVVRIDELPLTGSGKIDHKLLPRPQRREAVADLDSMTEVEAQLHAVFLHVLGYTDPGSVSLTDNFFEIGGDSLRATRLASRINSALELAVSVRVVFENPTIAGLAEHISQLGEAQATAIERVGDMVRTEVIPASHGQASLWVVEELMGGSDQYIVPVVHRLAAGVDVHAFATAVADVVRRHEALRTRLLPDDVVRVRMDIVAPESIPDTLVEVVRESEVSVRSVVERIVNAPVVLSRDLPIRGTIVVGGAGASLYMGIHHSAIDEWSIPTFMNDLAFAYEYRAQGQAPQFEPLAVQYPEFALWQRAVLGSVDEPGSLISSQLQYWTGVLDGAPPLSGIPVDRPRPANPRWSAGMVSCTIPVGTAEALRATASASNTSVFVLLHVITALALRAMGAGNDVVIASPVAGRTDSDLDKVVGYFVNTLPFRHTIVGSPTIGELVASFRSRVLDGLEGQSAPFEQIVRALGVERHSSITPIFQNLLTYVPFDGTVDAGDTLFTDEPVDSGSTEDVRLETVKTDLDVTVYDLGTEILVEIEYANELYLKLTVERFAAAIQSAAQFVAGPADTRLTSFSG